MPIGVNRAFNVSARARVRDNGFVNGWDSIVAVLTDYGFFFAMRKVCGCGQRNHIVIMFYFFLSQLNQAITFEGQETLKESSIEYIFLVVVITVAEWSYTFTMVYTQGDLGSICSSAEIFCTVLGCSSYFLYSAYSKLNSYTIIYSHFMSAFSYSFSLFFKLRVFLFDFQTLSLLL